MEITIEFNIAAIGKWLKTGGKFKDIDKIKRDWTGEGVVIQKYVIDMFPIGKNHEAYFHRNKGVISQNIGGIDFLDNANEDLRWVIERESKIELLAWEMWRGCLRLRTDKDVILFTPPLTEVIELQTIGTLSNFGNPKDADTKIKVPISFNANNTPKEFMTVWRGSASERSLGYGNALGHVSFSTLNFEVEY